MVDKSLVGKQFGFNATIENWAEGMDYCAVRVPATITESLGTRGPVLVSATVNQSEPFQVSLFPVGGGKHCIRIKSSVRKLTNTKVGDLVHLECSVLDPDDVTIPDDLLDTLEAERMMHGFMDLPPGKRHYLIRKIRQAAKPPTRQKRVREALEAAVERARKKGSGLVASNPGTQGQRDA